VELLLSHPAGAEQGGHSQSCQSESRRLRNSRNLNRTVRRDIGGPDIGSNRFETVLDVPGRIVNRRQTDAEHSVHQRGGDRNRRRIIWCKILDERDARPAIAELIDVAEQGVSQHIAGEREGLAAVDAGRLHVHIRVHGFVSHGARAARR